MSSQASQPLVYRPQQVEEALALLARPMRWQLTAGMPPPRPDPHAAILDISRITATGGLMRAGGELLLGVGLAYHALIPSRLPVPAAAALIDACRWWEEREPGRALVHDLQAPGGENPVILALALLGARADVASLGHGGVETTTIPLQQALHEETDSPRLILRVRVPSGPQGASSALVIHPPRPPLQPDVRMAAAWLVLDPSTGLIRRMRWAVVPSAAWPSVYGEALFAPLQGRRPDAATIEAAVRLVQQNAPRAEGSSPLFAFALWPQLVRETLNLAIARGMAS